MGEYNDGCLEIFDTFTINNVINFKLDRGIKAKISRKNRNIRSEGYCINLNGEILYSYEKVKQMLETIYNVSLKAKDPFYISLLIDNKTFKLLGHLNFPRGDFYVTRKHFEEITNMIIPFEIKKECKIVGVKLKNKK